MPRYTVPKITWGAAFANTLSCGWALDQANAYSKLREGSEVVQLPSGVEDAWVTGHDQYLEGTARYIPITGGTTPQGTTISGWDGATGFRAFLEWARAKNTFRFFPDVALGTFLTCYLVEPTEAPELEDDFTRRVRFVVRTADGSPFTGY